jgi:hypothetical protein
MRVPDRTKHVTYTKMLETRKQIIDHRATTSNQAFKLGFCEKETIEMIRGDEDTIRSYRERERGVRASGEMKIRSDHRERERGQGRGETRRRYDLITERERGETKNHSGAAPRVFNLSFYITKA